MPIDYANIPMTLEHRDAVTAAASPRPWRVIDKPNGQLILYSSIVENSDGRSVAFVCHPSDAALIVAAVNKHGMPIVELVRACDALKDECDRLREELDAVKANAKSEKRDPSEEDEFDPAALKSYPRPWSVSIDDENCRAVIRDADGLEVAYISDVIRSRAGETAQMFVGLVDERDRLRDLVRRLANMAEATLPDAEEYWKEYAQFKEGFTSEAYALIREAREAIAEGGRE